MTLPEQVVRFATAYGNFEKIVQNLVNQYCRPFCSRCNAVCCRSWFCRETLESPFLDLVRRLHSPHTRWSDDSGWLGKRGCRLHAGRPLICYEFLCSPILETHPDDERKRPLVQLSALLGGAGRHARGSRHLLEVTDLRRVNWPRLEMQLIAARNQLERILAESSN